MNITEYALTHVLTYHNNDGIVFALFMGVVLSRLYVSLSWDPQTKIVMTICVV